MKLVRPNNWTALGLFLAAGSISGSPAPERCELEVVFDSTRDGSSEIYLLSIGSKNARQITHMADPDIANRFPDWSPDWRHIVFVSENSRGVGDLFIVEADGSDLRRLTHDPAFYENPAWSPDREWIVFVKGKRDDWGLYLVRPDGTDLRRLGGENLFHPSWSPDAGSLALVTGDGDRWSGVIRPLGSTESRRITPEGLSVGSVSWSPDGRRIAFDATEGDNFDLYLIDVTGNNLRRLTDSPAIDARPEWSPKGDKLVFHSTRDFETVPGAASWDQYELYLLDLTTGDITRLTDNDDFDAHPDWCPGVEVQVRSVVRSDCPDPAGSSPTRAEWADTFTVESEELEGWVDEEYRFHHANPAYPLDAGPRVCVDEWHYNRHTIRGIYRPFAELLRGDGYRVTSFRKLFTSEALAACEILVVANPQSSSNMFGPGAPRSNWAYPHASALTADEISAILAWIRAGGALFLISDHAPLAAAVSDLGLLLGVHMLDGYTYASVEDLTGRRIGEIVFGTVPEAEWQRALGSLRRVAELDFDARSEQVLAAPGALAAHPVLDGRGAHEKIEWILTYTGQSFLVTDEWEPVLVFGSSAVSEVPWIFNLNDVDAREAPRFSVAGWLQGATRKLDRGRVALLGDGNICSAALDDQDGELESPLIPEGINDPRAPANGQFCLNMMHWLSGLLD